MSRSGLAGSHVEYHWHGFNVQAVAGVDECLDRIRRQCFEAGYGFLSGGVCTDEIYFHAVGEGVEEGGEGCVGGVCHGICCLE